LRSHQQHLTLLIPSFVKIGSLFQVLNANAIKLAHEGGTGLVMTV
jgi:hypothetical protein